MPSYFLHLILQDTNKHHFRKTLIYQPQSQSSDFQQLLQHVHHHYKYLIDNTSIQILTNLNGLEIKNKKTLVATYFDDQQDIFLLIKPNQTNKQNQNQLQQEPNKKYDTITKYSFIGDGEKWVKVILELKGIESHPKSKISLRFFRKSLDLKIDDFDNKNLSFGVNRTQCSLNTQESRYTTKPGKLIIWIRKVKKEDNWFSLFKTKTIGGDDSDD